jgi:hypothetical protein
MLIIVVKTSMPPIHGCPEYRLYAAPKPKRAVMPHLNHNVCPKGALMMSGIVSEARKPAARFGREFD